LACSNFIAPLKKLNNKPKVLSDKNVQKIPSCSFLPKNPGSYIKNQLPKRSKRVEAKNENPLQERPCKKKQSRSFNRRGRTF